MGRNIVKYVFGIFICLICMFGLNEIFAFGPSSDRIYRGIDVSEWQGKIDFGKVKETGIEVVYIKASEGVDYIDHYFEENYRGAKAAGLKVGFYHFVTARNVSEAEAEARFFARVISGKEIELRLAMDFESFGTLNIEEINEISEAFLTTLEEVTGQRVVIYSDANNARNIFSNELAETYPIWVAEYFVNEPSNNNKWETWVGFQYTDRDIVDGVNEKVDGDEFTDGIFLEETASFPEVENKPITERTIEYVVRTGDTLYKIAVMFDTTVERIVQDNDISNPNLIYPGQILRITNVDNPEKNIQYIVKRGDTLSSIARRYGITVQKIVENNSILNPNLIYPGEILNISTVTYDRYDTLHTIYRVQRGNTLSQIAREYNTTVEDLAELNDIKNVNLIFTGQVLRIYQK